MEIVKLGFRTAWKMAAGEYKREPVEYRLGQKRYDVIRNLPFNLSETDVFYVQLQGNIAVPVVFFHVIANVKRFA